MSDAQKTAAVIVRLLALYIVVHGVLGLAGFTAFRRMAGMEGMMGMAAGSAFILLVAGAVLFLGAPVVARIVTFDMD